MSKRVGSFPNQPEASPRQPPALAAQARDDWPVPRRHPWLLALSVAALVAWLIFLAWMAFAV